MIYFYCISNFALVCNKQNGHTALMHAAESNTTDAVRLLLEHGAGGAINQKEKVELTT